MMEFLKTKAREYGAARWIITLFLLVLFLIAGFFQVSRVQLINNTITRFGMVGILVLSLVPMIQSGAGLNFGIPVGIISGLLAEAIVMEYRLSPLGGFLCSCLLGIIFGLILGYLYGKLLNMVKGDEMMIATYVGYSIIYFFQILWVSLPFKNPASVQGYKGEGLRVTISLDDYWRHILDDFWRISIYVGNDHNGQPEYLEIPTGTILVLALGCFLMWLFMRSKTGTAMTAVGSNPEYSRASGVNNNRMRTLSVMISTAVAAVGIIIYAQSFGFAQYYTAANNFTFPTVAAILLGGASVTKASITNVLLGAFLFQGVISMTPAVINSAIQIDMSDVLRMIITNGLIIYALTRKGGKHS